MSKPITEPLDVSNPKDLFVGPSPGDGQIVLFMVDGKYYFADWVTDQILDNTIEELSYDEYTRGLSLMMLYHNTESLRLNTRSQALWKEKQRNEDKDI